MSKRKEDTCHICSGDTSNGYMTWHGLPFKKMDRSATTLCFCCLSSMRSEIVPLGDEEDGGIAVAGTNTGDVYSLNEMIEDGFSKKEATSSIRAVGKALGISASTIRDRLKR